MTATPTHSIADLASLFGLLSDETRLHLVFLLAKGDHNVMNLCDDLKLPQPNVSHHLGLLRMRGVVVAKRTGKQVIYSLAENFKTSGGKLKISLPTAAVTVEAGDRQIAPGKQKSKIFHSGGALFDLA